MKQTHYLKKNVPVADSSIVLSSGWARGAQVCFPIVHVWSRVTCIDHDGEHEPIIHVERRFIIKRLVKKVSVFVDKLEKSTLKNICCYQYTSIEKSG